MISRAYYWLSHAINLSQLFPRMLEVALSDVDRKLHFHVISALVMSVAKTNDRRNSGKMSAFEGLLSVTSDKLPFLKRFK